METEQKLIRHHLKPVTVAFISAEFLDFLTTYIGLNFMGHIEANPLATYGMNFVYLFKLVVTILVAWRLQVLENYKALWIIPIMAGIPVIWNILILLNIL